MCCTFSSDEASIISYSIVIYYIYDSAWVLPSFCHVSKHGRTAPGESYVKSQAVRLGPCHRLEAPWMVYVLTGQFCQIRVKCGVNSAMVDLGVVQFRLFIMLHTWERGRCLQHAFQLCFSWVQQVSDEAWGWKLLQNSISYSSCWIFSELQIQWVFPLTPQGSPELPRAELRVDPGMPVLCCCKKR